MCQEAVLATFFLGVLDKIIIFLVLPVFEPRFEPETSPKLCTIVNNYTTTFFSETYLF